jgi:stage IV sporulation protein B
MNEYNAQEKKYRKILGVFLIADIIIMVFLAVYYFGGYTDDVEDVPYENAQLVFDDLSDIKVIPSGEPVGIYLKTDGVMVVATGEVKDSEGQLCCPSEGILETGDYITEINGVSVTTKKELIAQVSEC